MAGSARVPSRRIFLSYRREDTAYPAGWLYDRLAERFGVEQVFKDVDSIQPGDDFVEVITEAVGSCDVLLALIGDRWLATADGAGKRRIDEPGDFVRLEIEAALTRGIRVVPILVSGATMPGPGDLPPGLAKLAHRQALELSPNRFNSDLSVLLRVLDNITSRTPPGNEARPGRQSGPSPRPSAPTVDFASFIPRAPFHDRYYNGHKLADWKQRAGAHLIDWLPLVPGIIIWYTGNERHLWWGIAIGVLLTVPLWLYNRWYRQGKTGQSWGKRVLRLRLIGVSDENPVGLVKAALRDLAHYLDIVLFYISAILLIFDARRQTLADKVSRQGNKNSRRLPGTLVPGA
jgi:RDD family/TIR domain